MPKRINLIEHIEKEGYHLNPYLKEHIENLEHARSLPENSHIVINDESETLQQIKEAFKIYEEMYINNMMVELREAIGEERFINEYEVHLKELKKPQTTKDQRRLYVDKITKK